MRVLSLLALLVLVAGCDGFSGAEEQRSFELTALGTASDGETADDWRVGPVFGARVQIIDQDTQSEGVQGANPNPARTNDGVSIQIYADESMGGFAVYRRQPDGALQLIQALPGASGSYIYTFTFFGGEASPTGSGSSRIVVLDGLERVVTYGDLVVSN